MRKHTWKEYNQNLVNRGSLTFFIDKEALKPLSQKKKSRGRPTIKKGRSMTGPFLLEVERIELSSLANSTIMTTCLSPSASQLLLMEGAPLGSNPPFVISNLFPKRPNERIHTRKF